MSASSTTGAWREAVLAILAGLVVTLVVSAVTAPRASADSYGLPQVVSFGAGSLEPNGPAEQLAISANGRYILYEEDATDLVDPNLPPGSPANAGGLYRYDTETGATELAAYGYFTNFQIDNEAPGGAQNAAISANGQYVLFTSNRLLPSDPVSGTPEQVYIRNMNEPADQASSYTMPIGAQPAQTLGPHGFSNDGSTLLWTSQATSNGFTNGVTYWTDTTTGVTLPVSVAYDQASHTMNPNQPLTDALNSATDGTGDAQENAVLSGDGSTVAWYSSDVTKDTGLAPGEKAPVPGVVWRRLADGARAVTRRVTTAADIENPDCTAATPITTDPTPPGPCDNPNLDTATLAFGDSVVPGSVVGLSDDGQEVAVLADGHARGSGISGKPLNPLNDADLYVVRMFPGQDPVDAMQPLTRALPGGEGEPPDTNAPIAAVAMSGDGRYVVFETQRILFPMDPPTQVGTFPAFVGAYQLYLVDLQSQQLQLLTQTSSGAVADQGTGIEGETGIGSSMPVVSDDGQTIAFLSSSDNLEPGIANGFTNAFMVQQQPASGSNTTGPQVEQLPATAPDLSPQPDWSLLVDGVSSAPDGTVAVTVEPPAAGSLSATVADGGGQLAGTEASAAGAGPVTLTLQPHVTDAQGNPGVKRTRSDTALVQFTPLAGAGAGGGPLADNVPVTFDLPAEKIGVRARPVSKPRAVRLALTLPAPGRVTVAATRMTRHAHRVKTVRFTTLTKRVVRAGGVPIMLAASRGGRRGLPAGRVPLRLRIKFVPSSAGAVPPLTRTLTATLPSATRHPVRVKHRTQKSKRGGRR